MQPDPFTEDIPLEESVKKNTTITATTTTEWHEHYKTVIGNAIRFSQRLAAERVWAIVEPPNAEQFDPVTLYERPVDKKGFYGFKVAGIVQGRAERYYHVLNDHQKATRGKWDTEDVLDDMEQFETYCSTEGDITVVQSTIKSPVPLMVAHRFLFGVRWSAYNPKEKRHTIVFSTCDHPLIQMPQDGRVAAHAMLRADIQQLEDGNTCMLGLHVHFHFGGSPLGLGIWVNKYKERLRQRVYLYQKVVAEWDTYYGPTRDPKVSGTEAREKLFD